MGGLAPAPASTSLELRSNHNPPAGAPGVQLPSILHTLSLRLAGSRRDGRRDRKKENKEKRNSGSGPSITGPFLVPHFYSLLFFYAPLFFLAFSLSSSCPSTHCYTIDSGILLPSDNFSEFIDKVDCISFITSYSAFFRSTKAENISPRQAPLTSALQFGACVRSRQVTALRHTIPSLLATRKLPRGCFRHRRKLFMALVI